MGGNTLIFIIVGLIISAFLGNYIAKEKGRDTAEGILFGLFLGFLGLIILGLLPNKSKKEITNSPKEPPSERAIKKAANNDLFGRIVGYTILFGIIILILKAIFDWK